MARRKARGKRPPTAATATTSSRASRLFRRSSAITTIDEVAVITSPRRVIAVGLTSDGKVVPLGSRRVHVDPPDRARLIDQFVEKVEELLQGHAPRRLVVVPPSAWVAYLPLSPDVTTRGIEGMSVIQEEIVRRRLGSPSDLTYAISSSTLSGRRHPFVTVSRASWVGALSRAFERSSLPPVVIYSGVSAWWREEASNQLDPLPGDGSRVVCLVRRDRTYVGWLSVDGTARLVDVVLPSLASRDDLAPVLGRKLRELVDRFPDLGGSIGRVELFGSLGRRPARLAGDLADELNSSVVVVKDDHGNDGMVEADALFRVRASRRGSDLDLVPRESRGAWIRRGSSVAAIVLIGVGLFAARQLAERLQDGAELVRSELHRQVDAGDELRWMNEHIQDRVARFEQWKKVVDRLAQSRIEPTSLLARLTAGLDDDVHLRAFGIEQPVAGPTSVSLRGKLTRDSASGDASLQSWLGAMVSKVGSLQVVREKIGGEVRQQRDFEVDAVIVASPPTKPRQ